jgi:hypothetical protein
MRVGNIIALIEQRAIVEATALLPITLCLAAIRLETIPRTTRSHLLRIGFFLVWTVREFRHMQWDKNPETVKKIHRHKPIRTL